MCSLFPNKECAFYIRVRLKKLNGGHLLQLHEAAPSINYYDMLCSLCKRSMLFCVGFFQFVISASKFSRSPYLDNNLSESTHTWTICTL